MSEHRDPAKEAALRTLIAITGREWMRGEALEAAAREALAPIRDLHESWSEAWATPPMWDEGGTAQNTVHLLLRDLARLIYTSEELPR